MTDSSDSEVEERLMNRPTHRNGRADTQYNCIAPWNKELNGITTLHQCGVLDARGLYIFDSAHKLLQNDQYDIGGAYSENGSLWFYFTTTAAPNMYLMNIFVCQRKPGVFALAITDSCALSTTIHHNNKFRTLSNVLEWKNFSSTIPDEVHHIKTISFSENDRLSLAKMVLIVPILIKMNCKRSLDKDLVYKIKAEHDFGKKLFKDIKPDFVITSGEGKTFNVHKIVIATHSPVLRDLIRDKECKSLKLDMSNTDIGILLNFLYTGTIVDIFKQPLEALLIMADKFKLNGFKELVKHSMKLSIHSNNALDMAVLAERYNYKDVQEEAFKYVAHHPEVLHTKAFSQINNANVVKELLRYIHLKPSSS